MSNEQDLKNTIEQYADTVKRICYVYLKNDADTDDIFQNVFLKYYTSSAHFESEEHKKAWIIRITINQCKDLLKSFFRKNLPIEEAVNLYTNECSHTDFLVRQSILKLPQKYKIVIYLHYYEGYTAVEIGKILNKNVNTIYTYLSRARDMLKNFIGGTENEW